jgi:hypothetical protein
MVSSEYMKKLEDPHYLPSRDEILSEIKKDTLNNTSFSPKL